MHFVDLAGNKILAKNGDTAADSDVLTLGCLHGSLQCRVQSVSDEVECGVACHLERSSSVMRQHEHGRVVGRSLAPPAFPGIVQPRTAHRTEHVAAQYPGANILEHLCSKIVVDSCGSSALTVDILEYFRMHKPRVQFEPAHSHRIVELLPGTGAEAIDGYRKSSNSYFGHGISSL